jgi:FkbM family methyltransferase
MRLAGAVPLLLAAALAGGCRPEIAADRPAAGPTRPPASDSPSSAPPTPRRDIVGTEKARYSQHGEEVVIRDFVQDRRGGFFLDVGCALPVQDSKTYYLEERLGWTGFGVDALPEFARKWKRRRPNSRFFNFMVTDRDDSIAPFFRAELRVRGISAMEKPVTGPGGRDVESEEIQVPTTTLTRLLDDNGIEKVDFLSMDIEGAEPLALAGFDIDRFRPELACIEAKPKNRELILKYFAEHGYQRIERYARYDKTNYYFARDPDKP